MQVENLYQFLENTFEIKIFFYRKDFLGCPGVAFQLWSYILNLG